MHTHASAPGRRSSRTPTAPVWATFSLTWVNNIGASAGLMGIYFIAVNAHGFSERENIGLQLLQGVTYIAGALTAGPLGRRLAGPGRVISTRALTGLVMLAMAGCCWLPLVWRHPGALWVQMAVYSPLSGWLWPLIESFLASGRTGHDLRRTTGAFNFAWASCQFFSFWLLAPFMPRGGGGDIGLAEWAMPLLGLSHVAALVFLRWLPREPGGHDEGGDATLSPVVRDDYARLLAGARCLIVLGYVGFSAMNPLLPARLAAFDVPPVWQTPVTSIWMISRVVMFAVMAAWAGWHGRRITMAWSGALLTIGVLGILIAPNLPLLCASLVVFGVGHGAIYSSAFYYAMEVGSAGVDAGGKHEAVIGCGYTIGPLSAMAAASAAPTLGTEPKVAAAFGALSIGAGVCAWWLARRKKQPQTCMAASPGR